MILTIKKSKETDLQGMVNNIKISKNYSMIKAEDFKDKEETYIIDSDKGKLRLSKELIEVINIYDIDDKDINSSLQELFDNNTKEE